jgi:prephenate dehydrogenase
MNRSPSNINTNTDTNSGTDPLFSTLAIVGVGLMGGSIAAAAKASAAASRVIGVGRNAERLEAAQSRGLIDGFDLDLAAASAADIVVVCTPVNEIAGHVRTIAAASSSGLITDAGSTKRRLCESLAELSAAGRFVGSHPMAGSEKQGFEHASAEMLAGRVCVVTPTENTPSNSVDRVTAFWTRLGMRTLTMSPADHDRAVAEASHLAHVVAAAVVNTLNPDVSPLCATGFRDTTRVAAGDPHLWGPILMENREEIAAALDRFVQQLRFAARNIRFGDEAAIRGWLEQARDRRGNIMSSQSGS